MMTVRGDHFPRVFSRKSSSSMAVDVISTLLLGEVRVWGREEASSLAAASEFPVWDP